MPLVIVSNQINIKLCKMSCNLVDVWCKCRVRVLVVKPKLRVRAFVGTIIKEDDKSSPSTQLCIVKAVLL